MLRRLMTFCVLLVVMVCFGVGMNQAYGQTQPSRTDLYTDAGIIGLSLSNLGYVGNGIELPYQPSCEYPLNSNVEHLHTGGLWVGAVMADGTIHVSVGAQDATNLSAGELFREFQPSPDDQVIRWSNSQNSVYYDSRAQATQHIELVFDDFEFTNDTPLGVKVIMRVLAWDQRQSDDFVILDYSVINISESELRDVYLGFWNDATVGHTEQTNPYDSSAAVRWNYYDDANGGFGAAGYVPSAYTPADDPNIWLMYEYDFDAEEGLAPSWYSCRLLGSEPGVEPPMGQAPVAYNAWQFRHVPEQDDSYYAINDIDQTNLLPGKYQLMSNGAFTVGETQSTDYTIASDWVGLLSTGPFPSLAPNDTLNVTYAIVCGADSLSMLKNSKIAQLAYDEGFALPTGPPSPILEVDYAPATIVLHWAPGDSIDADTGLALTSLDPLRSPEHHISTITSRTDFQGYRIYRVQGDEVGDPTETAVLVAEFDKIDGVGFDIGLPPLNADGHREFEDTNLLNGFSYWYSVISYSAPDPIAALPELASGFNQNAVQVFPGPPAAGTGTDRQTVGVYPNPYRSASMFDDRTGSSIETERKIWFTGLPGRSKIQVFNLAGEVIRTINHDDTNAGQHSWNLLSDYGRVIASGLYIFAVTNLETDEIQRGKLVIIK